MKKMLSALILALGMSLSLNVNAECPKPVRSDVLAEGQGASGTNLYNLDGDAFSVSFTNVPWRMTQSNMFLSSLMGKNWYMAEHNPDKIILGAYADNNLFMVITERNGFMLIRSGNSKGFEKAAEIATKDKTCFSKFIKVD